MKHFLFGIFAAAAVVSACAINDDPQIESLGIPFKAVVSNGDEVKAISDAGSKIITNWAKDETIALVYLVGGTPYNTTATITSVDGTGKATIEATLQDGVTDGTSVTLIYPASAADGTTGNILSSVISAQDGALSSARDIRKGAGTISVELGTATLAEGATVPAAYAICKFSVWDPDDDELYLSSLKISDGSSVIADVTLASPDYEVFVTLPAMTGATLWFEGEASGQPYIAKGNATLTAGQYFKPSMTMYTAGNVIGANGKFYKNMSTAVSKGTTAAAIIAYIGDDTAEAGYTHGLAIAMKDAGGSTQRWRSSGSTTDNENQYMVAALAIAAKESGSVITASHNSSAYPAFQAALANTFTADEGLSTAAPSGTSGWFMASLFQWNQIIKGLSGESTDLNGMANSKLQGDAFGSKLTSAGVDRSRLWDTYYWTCTEYNATAAWRYERANGLISNNTKTYFNSVRAVLAF